MLSWRSHSHPNQRFAEISHTGIRMCHNLLLNYRLYEKMDVFVSFLPFFV